MGISLNIIKDQSLTLSVEEWLKTNEPHKLKMGESLGVVKARLGSSTKTVEENVANEKERERRIIKKEKPAPTINKLEIQKANRLKMQEAHENGKRNFMGICQKHGEEFFWIQKSPNTLSGLQYKCCQCNIKS